MTARALGIGKTTLYRKLKEYGISHWDSSPLPVPSTFK
jgi:DNA-binding NtrC family response regulator